MSQEAKGLLLLGGLLLFPWPLLWVAHWLMKAEARRKLKRVKGADRVNRS